VYSHAVLIGANMLKINNKGLTLAELIVATIIMGILMVGIASMDIGLRNMFEGTSKNTLTSSKVSLLVHHVSRTIATAIGDENNPGVAFSGSNIWIRTDSNITPSSYSDDDWYVYQFDSGNNNVKFCSTTDVYIACQTTIQTLGRGCITTFQPSIEDDSTTLDFNLTLKVSGRDDPSTAIDAFENPEYTVTSVFSLPSSGSSI